jgi:hypothetical protein
MPTPAEHPCCFPPVPEWNGGNASRRGDPSHLPCRKTMRFVWIIGDAEECPFSLFANAGRNRVPQTVI